MPFLQASCAFHCGMVRTRNEDNFCFNGEIRPLDENQGEREVKFALSKHSAVFGVFDGMGGLDRGEDASFLAADSFSKTLLDRPLDKVGKKDILARSFETMQEKVHELSKECGGRAGTTAVMLLFARDEVAIGNVGDSKAYLLRGGELRELSEEHTDRDLLERLGVKERKPTLTQYIGMPSEELKIEPCISARKVHEYDRYILCSDGLSGTVSNEEILATGAVSLTALDCAKALVDLVLEKGGKDNVTVIVCDIKP